MRDINCLCILLSHTVILTFNCCSVCSGSTGPPSWTTGGTLALIKILVHYEVHSWKHLTVITNPQLSVGTCSVLINTVVYTSSLCWFMLCWSTCKHCAYQSSGANPLTSMKWVCLIINANYSQLQGHFSFSKFIQKKHAGFRQLGCRGNRFFIDADHFNLFVFIGMYYLQILMYSSVTKIYHWAKFHTDKTWKCYHNKLSQ